MPKEITIIQSLNDNELDAKARELLTSGIDTGNDDVLNQAIFIAKNENLDVVFKSTKTGKIITPDLAFRIHFDRGLNIRSF